MPVRDRKKRQIADREQLVLDVARRLFLERGSHGVTMDRIAEGCEYSKGTIYGHFANKEEVVVALAIRAVEKTQRLFERAARFEGNTRERMCALGEAYAIFVQEHADDFRFWQMLRPDALRDKITPERQQVFLDGEQACMGIVGAIVSDAIADGDLVLRPGLGAGQIGLGLWSLCFGAYSLADSNDFVRRLAEQDVFLAVRRSCHALMDGYGWRPLFADWDYDATYARIHAEIFCDE